MNKKSFALLTALILVAALLFGVVGQQPAAAQGRTLTISTWGYNQDLIDKNITQPFEEMYDVTIVYETGNNSERLSRMLERGDNPGIDVAHFAGAFTYQAMAEGVLQPYDPAQLSNLGDLYDWAQDPLGGQYGIGYAVSSFGLLYNTDEISEPITSWRDLWREDVAGFVTVPDMGTTNGPATLAMMARAWGGDVMDVEPAWEKLPELVPNIITTYRRSSELTSLVQEGEVWVGPYASYAWGGLIGTGQPLESVIPEEGLAGVQSMVSVVKNTENEDLAHLYIDFLISHDVQLGVALDYVDSPTNMTVEVPEDVAANLTYGDEIISSLIFVDEGYAAAHQEEWINRWNTILTGQPDPGPSEMEAMSFEGQTLTVSTWGYNQDLLDKNITEPFEELYGVEVVYETGNNSDRLSRLLERGDNPGVDVAHFAGSYTYQAMEAGILVPYDAAQLPNLGELYDWAQDPLGGQYGIGYAVSSFGLLYNSDEVSEPITSWRDLWRDDVSGFVTVPDMGTTNGPATLIMMARAWGGDIDNVEPAWENLPDLVDNIVTTYRRSSELTSLVQEGEVWVGPYPSFAWGGLVGTGQPLVSVIPEEGLAGFQSMVSIVKGSENEALAHAYIDFLISHDVQLAEALDLVDSPTNTLVEVPEDVAANLTYGPEVIDNLLFIDEAFAAANQEEWINRWNAILTQ